VVISFDGQASDASRDPGSIPHGSRTKDDWTTTAYAHPFDFFALYCMFRIVINFADWRRKQRNGCTNLTTV
jgi:hypothetical protein